MKLTDLISPDDLQEAVTVPPEVVQEQMARFIGYAQVLDGIERMNEYSDKTRGATVLTTLSQIDYILQKKYPEP